MDPDNSDMRESVTVNSTSIGLTSLALRTGTLWTSVRLYLIATITLSTGLPPVVMASCATPRFSHPRSAASYNSETALESNFFVASVADGHVNLLNQRWCAYTGLSLEQACDWGWQTAICPQVLTFPHAGHAPHDQHPIATAEHIASFVRTSAAAELPRLTP
jgi:hypothetical protein